MDDPAQLVLKFVPRLEDGARTTEKYILVRCPFHGSGLEKTPSCSLSRESPVFFCHGCKESGHIRKLLALSNLSQDTLQKVIDDLRFDTSTVRRKKTLRMIYGSNPYRGRFILDDVETLAPYRQMKPQALIKDGFLESTLDFFEVGWDAKELRITYPLRNIYGELFGISGRTVLNVDPRYKIYKSELVTRKELNLPADYAADETKKATMWNFHTVFPSLISDKHPSPLVLTEGFKACMWTWQSGYQNAVALIGSYFSELHAELLARLGGPVILFLDNNEAGWVGTHKASLLMHRYGIPFTVANYPDEREQPDGLEVEELQDALTESLSYLDWRRKHEQSDEAA